MQERETAAATGAQTGEHLLDVIEPGGRAGGIAIGRGSAGLDGPCGFGSLLPLASDFGSLRSPI